MRSNSTLYNLHMSSINANDEIGVSHKIKETEFNNQLWPQRIVGNLYYYYSQINLKKSRRIAFYYAERRLATAGAI